MANESSLEGTSSGQINAESSESTIEVNVKTLDSQIYTFRVNKNMLISSFKEKISSTIGLPVGQQRLIFRGKVLKDNQLLSEYHLEDGHTLHLVVRQPVQSQTPPGSSSGGFNGNHDNRGTDSTPGAPRNRIGQVSHSMVLGTVNIGDQAEGIVPDLTRIIGSVLNSIGIGNLTPTGGSNGTASTTIANPTTQPTQGIETGGARENPGGRNQAGNQGQPGQAFLNVPFQTLQQSLQFPLQGAVAVPSLQMVIPDSLTTLSEFINRMELALSPNGNSVPSGPANTVEPPSQEVPSSNIRGLPTPQALATVIQRAQQLLSGHAGAALLSIARRLESQGASTDPLARTQIQSEAMRVGVAMQHLGSLLLELGRTIQTLRMGQSPAESFVNAGPAVYISPSGPNPIMVQPTPFQTSFPFGFSSILPQANSGIPTPVGLGEVPRHVNIHIHAETSVAPGISSVGTRANTGETTNVGQQPNQAQASVNGTGSGDSGPRRLLPVRSVVAAIPARSPAEAAGHVLSVVYPFHARPQQTTASNLASVQSSNPAASNGVQPIVGSSISQNSQSISVPAVVSQVHRQIINIDGNIQRDSSSSSTHGTTNRMHIEGLQVPSGTLETSSIHGFSVQPSAHDGVGDQYLENMMNNGSGMTTEVGNSSLPRVSEADGISGSYQQRQLDGSQFVNKEDMEAWSSTAQAASVSVSSTGESLNFPTVEARSSKPDVLSEKSTNEFVPGNASSTSQSQDPHESGKAVPLGLGSGGLQPMRRSKQVKSQVKDGITGTALPVSQNQNQESITRGQQVLQSLVSGGSNSNRAGASNSSMMLGNVFRQIMDSVPLGAQRAGGQIDVTSMMSQVLRSPVMNNILAGVSEQAGVGSPEGLRSIFEQLTQSPSMRNTLDQITQEVEGQSQDLGNMFSGLGREQGGIDFSRMFQQLMPVVSQALSQGSAIPETLHGVESEPGSSNNNMPDKDDQVDGNNSQIDFRHVIEQLEGHAPPNDVFRAVLENATHQYDDVNADFIEEICNDNTLANEFVEMLRSDIQQRLQSESKSADKS